MANHPDLDFSYELRVPGAANAGEGWETPAASEHGVNWEGTVHDLGRLVLAVWQRDCPKRYRGLPAYVEVRNNLGAYAEINDPTPASEPLAALEAAIEASQMADLASDMRRQELMDVMRDVQKFSSYSRNNIAHRVRGVMSRPTALKVLKAEQRGE
ncbi:hypothetical protein ACFXAF_00350 [Kitasatospora sp. NPDC059463]|uniref:hypothetical protein n=1 Tax=unclassified Kitasatospora TaxID=2633591 RepID=UPI0036CE3191